MTAMDSINESSDAYSINEFCERHRISRSHFYDLPDDDKPRLMRVGKRVLISREAAAAWRMRMEEKALTMEADGRETQHDPRRCAGNVAAR